MYTRSRYPTLTVVVFILLLLLLPIPTLLLLLPIPTLLLLLPIHTLVPMCFLGSDGGGEGGSMGRGVLPRPLPIHTPFLFPGTSRQQAPLGSSPPLFSCHLPLLPLFLEVCQPGVVFLSLPWGRCDDFADWPRQQKELRLSDREEKNERERKRGGRK